MKSLLYISVILAFTCSANAEIVRRGGGVKRILPGNQITVSGSGAGVVTVGVAGAIATDTETLRTRVNQVGFDTGTFKSTFNTFASTTADQITNALNANATSQAYSEATRNALSTATTEMHTLAVPTRVSNEGSNLGNVTALDFVGSAVDAAIVGTTVTVTVTGGSSARQSRVVIGTSSVQGADIVSTNADGFIAAISTLGGSSSGFGDIYVQDGTYDWTKAVGVPQGIKIQCASSATITLSGANSQFISSCSFTGCTLTLSGTGGNKVRFRPGSRWVNNKVSGVKVETGANAGKFELVDTSDTIVDYLKMEGINYTAANAALWIVKGASQTYLRHIIADDPVGTSGTGNNFVEYQGGEGGLYWEDCDISLKNRFMFLDLRGPAEFGMPSKGLFFNRDTFRLNGAADGSGYFFLLTNTAGVDLSTATLFASNTFIYGHTGSEPIFSTALTNGGTQGLVFQDNIGYVKPGIGANTATFVNLNSALSVRTVLTGNKMMGIGTFIQDTGDSTQYAGTDNYKDGVKQ